jgi:hypothetical protein
MQDPNEGGALTIDSELAWVARRVIIAAVRKAASCHRALTRGTTSCESPAHSVVTLTG